MVIENTVNQDVDGEGILYSRGKPLFDHQRKSVFGLEDVDNDANWVKTAFLVDDEKLPTQTDIDNRYWSSASIKYTDTRLGGNIGINSRPQFTRYCDIRSAGRLQGRQHVTLGNATGNYGMGRAYSENIDDPSQTIYLSFGVPKFNSVANFLAWAFDTNMSSISRTGKSTPLLIEALAVGGRLAMTFAFPAISILVYGTKFVVNKFIKPTTKYYTMQETMELYWSTVNTLVNALAVNRKLFPRILSGEPDIKGTPIKIDDEVVRQLHDLMPDVFGSDGYFDIFSVSGRAQRMATSAIEAKLDAEKAANPDSFLMGLAKAATKFVIAPTGLGLKEAMREISRIEYFRTDENVDARALLNPAAEDSVTVGADGKFQGNMTAEKASLATFVENQYRDGARYAIFKVNHTGSTQESFSNSVTESDVSQKLNSVSSQVKEARFTAMEGNIVGQTVKDVTDTVIGVASKALSVATFGIFDAVMGLAGAGYIDIPKHWQSSSASLNRTTYTMDLVSPYGNVVSQIINIDIPLCMLLAGTLPLSTGKQSYTSPFLCQLFDRGRGQIRLGMIESLSIERGTTNLAFNASGNALGLKVSFTVVDLSSIMHMPTSTGSLFGADMTLDEDNILMDYLAVLAGQDLYSQTYYIAKSEIELMKKYRGMQKLASPAWQASAIHGAAKSASILNPLYYWGQYQTLYQATGDVGRGQGGLVQPSGN